MRTLFVLLISLSFYVSSDDHSPEEKAVLAAHANTTQPELTVILPLW